MSGRLPVRVTVRVRGWNQKQLNASLRREMARRLSMATQTIRTHMVMLLSRSFFTFGPSKPGEPPHARTGRLRNSIVAPPVMPTDEPLVGLVGVSALYGKFLEFGTSKMAARPFVKKSIENARAAVVAILTRKPPGTP